MIQQRVHQKEWKPVKLGRQGPSISHLFFADDLMLFSQADMAQVDVFMGCLRDFAAASGLTVSLHKSKFFISPNVSRGLAQTISDACDIPLTNDLGRYLGVPIVHGRISKDLYIPIIEKIRSKLSNWKRNVLSRAGRRTLVQSVLSAIPIYTMQTVLLPISICNSIDRVSRNLLWRVKEDNSHGHLVNWNMVCRSKGDGGLGLRSEMENNVALLSKNAWRISQGDPSLACSVFIEKFLL